ncbi:MAG: hypothetical protein M3162_09490 [Thermoproteota archaeon]|nr:hypothetical protein [Thermoproteota archaeon]
MSENEDGSLDDARKEIAFIGKQISELSPLALSLKEKEKQISHDDVIDTVLSINDRIEWDDQFRELLKKLLSAQDKYIRLLERKVSKH